MHLLLGVLLVVGYDVHGIVALDGDVPIDSPVLVQLVKGANVPIDCTFSTVEGNFGFSDVAPGSYSILIQHEGFEDTLEHLEVPLITTVPTIYLHKRQNSLTSDEPQLGDRNQVSVRQLAIPPEAVRDYEKGLVDLREGKTERGIHHLTRALTIAPEFVEAAYELGDVLCDQQRYSEAEQILRQAIAVVPAEAHLHLAVARVLLRQHKYEQALAELDEYLQIGTKEVNHTSIERLRAKLKRHISN
jgi:tetratricopeptide (TPR) repeat protein